MMVTQEKMTVPEGQTLLVIHLDEADLSMGQLGALLRDLQTTVRGTAEAIDDPPPIRSVRVTGFKESSLEFVVQVVGWLPHVSFEVGTTIIEAAESVVGVATVYLVGRRMVEGARAVVRRYILRSRRGTALDRLEEALARLELLEQVHDRRERAAVVREVAQQIPCDPRRVEAAVRAVEALVRTEDLVALSGGGGMSSPPADRRIRIQPRRGPVRDEY